MRGVVIDFDHGKRGVVDEHRAVGKQGEGHHQECRSLECLERSHPRGKAMKFFYIERDIISMYMHKTLILHSTQRTVCTVLYEFYAHHEQALTVHMLTISFNKLCTRMLLICRLSRKLETA